ncbi:PP2C family protein-serine/threonine phosphatase [Parafrigoribacterium soli]|uniref:PP2C family protein-serine/threonine phosphatase n=1 Tax=Parafrigoribacterium soli TaxID=3144663 RepID=UPI0032F073EF
MAAETRLDVALASATVHLTFAGHSDRGAVRKLNEDSYLAAPPLFVVADGMGGHSFGDRASQAAIAAFAGVFDPAKATHPDTVLDTIRRANEAVLALTAGPGLEGTVSGTTLVGLALVELEATAGCHWMAFNVGDSRVYGWDGRSLSQLSVDHSAVQELVDQGEITKSEAAKHPMRNVVTRALGADDDVDADVWLFSAGDRQTFLLCSDGLTKELSDDEIARIIVFHNAASTESDALAPTLAERLVNAAIAAGGSDNVTVVVVESQLAGVAGADEDTIDRGMPKFLEETRPRA